MTFVHESLEAYSRRARLFPTLLDVVNHDDTTMSLGLSDQDKAALVGAEPAGSASTVAEARSRPWVPLSGKRTLRTAGQAAILRVQVAAPTRGRSHRSRCAQSIGFRSGLDAHVSACFSWTHIQFLCSDNSVCDGRRADAYPAMISSASR